jgi:hypothetical protein
LCNNYVKGVYIIIELNDKSFDPHGLGSEYKEGAGATTGANRSVCRVLRFRQADISRAVKGVKAAGVSVSQIEIGSDGRIVITSGEPQASQPPDEYANWKANRNARAA